MIVYLMRHGQTDWDASCRVLGLKDVSLNQTGLQQATLAAEKLKNQNIETIYASDLKPARKTANIISNLLDLPVHYTKKLREIDFGKAEGVKKTDLEAKFSYIYHAFNDINNRERYAIAYPGGETIGEVQQRFIKFMNRLYEDGRSNVLIISHGMFIRIFTESYLKKEISLDNGSVLKVTYDSKNKRFRTPKILF